MTAPVTARPFFRGRHLGILSSLLVLIAACGPSVTAVNPPMVAQQQTTLAPGDGIDVRVYGEEDLSESYTIQPDGTIDYPYVGTVEVEGLAPHAVADLLETRLREGGVLVHPHVSIEVTTTTSGMISVSGAVRTPGNYPVTHGLTVLQAVGLAGGTSDLANRDGAIVTRRVEGRMRRYAVPLDRITVGDAEDFPVQPGDILFVPERFL